MTTPAEEDIDQVPQEDAVAGVDDEVPVEELKALKRQRGRKASVFSRTCTAIDGLLDRQPDPGELKKRLETLNVALDGFLETNDSYVAQLEDMDEIMEAGQYASRVTTRHAELTKRIKEAATPPQQATSTEQDGSKISGSRASGRSRASVASKDAEISAELKALELRQLCARQQREEQCRKQEAEQKVKSVEEELEHARLKARLWKAAESELAWERRNDFEEEGVREPTSDNALQLIDMHLPAAHPEEQQSVVRRRSSSTAQTTEGRPRVAFVNEQQSAVIRHDVEAAAPAETRATTQSGRNPADWVKGLGSDHPAQPQSRGSSAFVKSIPRLSLPTFRGEPREWPRWIGLFKALVHDQPSLTDSERMAHLQSAVDGPASQAIDGMLFNGALYQEVLITLQERFGREEDVTQAHLRSIFNAVPPSLSELSAMEKFYAVVHNTVTVLRNLGYDSDLKSSENLRRVVEKLPSELSRAWGGEVYRLRPERPSLETFSEWLKVQVGILSYSAVSSTASDRRHPAAKHRDSPTARKSAFVTGATCSEEVEPRFACVECKAEHKLADCPTFKAKTTNARMDVVYAEKLCFSCLRKGHWSRRCRSARRCGIDDCRFKHHPLLHDSKKPAEANEDVPLRQEGTRSTPFVAASFSEETNTLLQVIRVRIHGPNKSKDVLALLDAGAQTSLCSEDVLCELGIAGQRRQLRIQNVEGSGAQKSSQRVSLTISALDADGRKDNINIPEVWSVPALNVTAPTVTRSQMQSCEHLRGLEFSQYNGDQVELLIGANVLEAVLQRETRVGRPNQPVAVKTDLGWTLTGSVSAVVPSSLRQVMCTRQTLKEPEDALSAAVDEWWSTESFGTKYCERTTGSKEDERAIKLLEENTVKNGGRYRTGLLWQEKESRTTFPDNKPQAMKRLQATERKLEKQPEVAAKYKTTIDGYVADGHARKLDTQEAAVPNERRWLLPHHAVTNPNKPGKVRVVFDAAADYRGVSLNKKLLTGPDLLQSLPGVLLRFREGPVAIAADIKQMYHQIEIKEDDQPAISFLWRDLDSRRPPDMYQMQVLIFGARSSPAIANYVLRRTLQDHWMEEKTGSERGPEQIQQCFYMDDFLLSDADVEIARQLKQEATRALAEGGFQLTKWRSNEHEVVEDTLASSLADPDGVLCLGAPTAAAEKALGVVWDEKEDTLGFRLRETSEPLTKRGVLSQAASVFDPLGMAAPFTVQARIMMQRLWTRQLSWDDPLPEPELSQWLNWLHESNSLRNIKVSRCVRPREDVKSQELHVFCDASEAAFGAVIYMRSTTNSNVHHCRFLIAKNRVAPLKKLSIVRLELQAALLGARLTSTVLTELSRKPDAVFYWSDSSVVLQYLSNESRRFHTFVANRVAEVKELTAGGTWRHVPGKLNPADDCSRGLDACELMAESRWLSGPAFLCRNQEDWPVQVIPAPLTDEVAEVKPAILVSAVGETCEPLPDPAKFSCWLRCRRVAAWTRRFVHNAAADVDKRRRGPLTSQELKDAEIGILKQTQKNSYPEEMRRLTLGYELPTKSSLLPLSPYCDENGLLRVGGRLGNAPVVEDARHPVILPRHGEVTRLVILQEHIKSGHAGVEHTLNELRQKYWVVKGRTAVKQLLQRCPTCRRLRALPKPPLMASLPAERFDASRPFNSTGIDIFGPFYVKRLRRTEKRYGLLATCMTTRAVHLEVVHSLDTDSCTMALRRFFSRRGRPSVIISDNGTNFVGSCREMKAELQTLGKEMAENLSAYEVDWRFNPPAASHMGGVWERMVRSVKNSLRVVVGRQTLTDETLVTVFAEVEHMVNSRPLTHVSSEPTDPEALTPNHFLLGGASRHLAPGLVRDGDLCSRRRWKHVQAVAEHVWRRWSKEYVPTLVQRSKWRQEQRSRNRKETW